ncbi:hypothetical protein C0993_005310 [Termitomyces sp. T159_Od127]|nr:hypothetical protein C0993_005310 [Termitomyces sp. T159_Od127]
MLINNDEEDKDPALTTSNINSNEKKVLRSLTTTPPAVTSWWGAANPMVEEWLQCDAYARSMITLNVVNSVDAGIKMNGLATDAWSSLTALHDAKLDLRLIYAEEGLNTLNYIDEANIAAHFKALKTAWSKANNQGVGINDKRF